LLLDREGFSMCCPGDHVENVMIKTDARQERTTTQIDGFRQAVTKVAEEKPVNRAGSDSWKLRRNDLAARG
jgi:hypothetical protein